MEEKIINIENRQIKELDSLKEKSKTVFDNFIEIHHEENYFDKLIEEVKEEYIKIHNHLKEEEKKLIDQIKEAKERSSTIDKERKSKYDGANLLRKSTGAGTSWTGCFSGSNNSF